MDISELLSGWCDRFTDVMLDNPGDPHCPACAALIELQRLRAQVDELLPWAKFGAKHLLEYEHEDQTEWRVTVGVEPSTVSVEKARVFDARITNGDFGEVE